MVVNDTGGIVWRANDCVRGRVVVVVLGDLGMVLVLVVVSAG